MSHSKDEEACVGWMVVFKTLICGCVNSTCALLERGRQGLAMVMRQ